jgi:hypothetical protein
VAYKIGHILERFRELQTEIQETALRDVRFRGLCEDYEAAADAFELWSKSTDVRAPKMVREYRQLLTELEAEIFAQVQGRP